MASVRYVSGTPAPVDALRDGCDEGDGASTSQRPEMETHQQVMKQQCISNPKPGPLCRDALCFFTLLVPAQHMNRRRIASSLPFDGKEPRQRPKPSRANIVEGSSIVSQS